MPKMPALYFSPVATQQCSKMLNIDYNAIAHSGNLMQETQNTQIESDQLTNIETTQPIEKVDLQRANDYFHFYKQVDPLPDQTPNNILERKYHIGTISWSSTDDTNALVWSALFPKAIMDVSPVVTNMLKQFEYFRAGVELEFHVAGTMNHKGALIIANLPFVKDVSDPKLGTTYHMSSCDPVILSCGTNTTVTSYIPFRMLTSHWKYDMGTAEGFFGAAVARVLVPLSIVNQSGATSINVSVFAKFINPEVMGPTLHQNTTSEVDLDNNNVLPVAHSLVTPGNGGNFNVQMTEAIIQRGDREAENKSKTGVLTKILETASGISSFLAFTPIGGPAAYATGAGLKLASIFTRKMGFDKPNSVETTKPVFLTTTTSLAPGNGLNVQNTLGIDCENSISRQPEDFATNKDETHMRYLAGLPGLIKVGSFNSTAASGTTIYGWENHPNIPVKYGLSDLLYFIPFCALVSSFFAYWRGDMKYQIRFFGNKFSACKVRITWGVNAAETALAQHGGGDIPSKIIEVAGDTTVSFSVPYLSHLPYSKRATPLQTLQDNEYAGYIRLQIVNPTAPLASANDTVIYYTIFAACGENFDWQAPYPLENSIQPSTSHLIKWQMYSGAPAISHSEIESANIRASFSKPFPPLFPSRSTFMHKVISGEETTSFLTLLHRFCNVGTMTIATDANQPNFYDLPTPVTTNTYTWTPLNVLRYTYLLFRGGISYKLVPRVGGSGRTNVGADVLNESIRIHVENCLQPYDPITFNTDQMRGLSGCTFESLQYKPVLEFNVPFYSHYPFRNRPYTYPTLFRGYGSYNYNAFQTYLDSPNPDLTYVEADIWLALSDDAQFGNPLGTPTMVGTNISEIEEEDVNPIEEFELLRSHVHDYKEFTPEIKKVSTDLKAKTAFLKEEFRKEQTFKTRSYPH